MTNESVKFYVTDEAKADSRQFVRVEFHRAIVNIRPGEARHPWYWCISIQDGHIYAIGSGKDTLDEAIQEFREIGSAKVSEVEKRLACMYAAPNQIPYDVAARNPEKSCPYCTSEMETTFDLNCRGCVERMHKCPVGKRSMP